MARWIKTNGETKEVHPKNGTDYSLEELQGFVGGFIEIVRVDDDRIMVVNEEGKLNGLPINGDASKLYGRETIVGDVLVCKREEVR